MEVELNGTYLDRSSKDAVRVIEAGRNYGYVCEVLGPVRAGSWHKKGDRVVLTARSLVDLD